MAAVGGAEGAVDEEFDLESRLPLDLPGLLEGNFPAQDQSHHPHAPPQPAAIGAEARGLGREVDGQFAMLPHRRDHPQVGADHGIGLDGL